MSKVPSSWSKDKLGNIAEVIMGQSPSSDTYNQSRIGLPFFQGKADFGDKFPETRMWCSQPQKVACKGDILFSVRAPVGDVNINITESCIGRGLAAIRAKQNSDFLYYQLIFSKSKFVLLSQGSTFEAINGSELKDFDFLLPPVVEQKKIAEILTSVDRVIELTSLEIDKLKDLKKGMMQELLTKGIGHTKFKDSPVGKIPENWECFKLNDIFKMMTGATPLRSNELYFKEGKIPWIKTGEIENCFIYKTEEYITELAVKETNAKLYPVDSILIAMYGAGKTRGQVGLLKTPAASNQACCALVMKNYSYNKILYCFYYLMSQYDNLRAESEGGDRLNLSLEKIRNYDIPLPTSILEIEKLSMAIHSVFNRINSKLEKLNTLKIIKKGLMNDLLTGKVRVKV